MKKFVWFMTLVLTFSLVLSACGTPATQAPAPTQAPATVAPATEAPATEAPATAAPTEAPAAGKFRVAVVMPSAKNDLAFSQSMYDALIRIQNDMGGPDKFEIVLSENMFVVDDAAAAQGGFVNGVMAATLPKSKVIGVFGPIETGDAKLYVDGFKAGVAATNP